MRINSNLLGKGKGLFTNTIHSKHETDGMNDYKSQGPGKQIWEEVNNHQKTNICITPDSKTNSGPFICMKRVMSPQKTTWLILQWYPHWSWLQTKSWLKQGIYKRKKCWVWSNWGHNKHKSVKENSCLDVITMQAIFRFQSCLPLSHRKITTIYWAPTLCQVTHWKLCIILVNAHNNLYDTGVMFPLTNGKIPPKGQVRVSEPQLKFRTGWPQDPRAWGTHPFVKMSTL